MSYNSKYKGQEVERLLDLVASGNAGGGSVKIPIIEHGENDTTITIESNTYHKWGEVRELTISLGEPTDESVVNEYMFSFDNISLTPRLTIDELMWEHGEYPEFTFLAKNVVKIMDGLAKIESFALSSIVLSNEYDLEEQEQAMQLYNTIASGEYSPGEYSTNGASIYVYVYLEAEYRYINERVISFGIPIDFLVYPLIVHTESGKQFYLKSNGILYLS